MNDSIFYGIASLVFLIMAIVLMFLPDVPEYSSSFSIVMFWQMRILGKISEMNQ